MINFAALANTLSFVNNVFPIMLETIKVAESAFPNSGSGASKLNLVTTTLQSAAKAANVAVVTSEQIIPLFTPIISATVATLNATGEFKAANTVTSAVGSVGQVGVAIGEVANTVTNLASVSAAINA